MFLAGNANIGGSVNVGESTVITSDRKLGNITSVNQSLSPTSDNTFDLGSTSARWRDLHLSRDLRAAGAIYAGGSEVITSDRVLKNIASVDQSVVPTLDATYDLGSSTTRWRDLYLSRNANVGGSVYVGGSEVITSDRTLKNTKIVCANKGLTAVTVTETTATLKQSLTPDSGYFGFPYIEGINIVATNPSGSGVTLYLQTRVLLDNNTEVALHDWESVSAGASLDDWLRFIYDIIPHARAIKEIRLYAYCSSTPATGYEPKVNVNKVTGVMC